MRILIVGFFFLSFSAIHTNIAFLENTKKKIFTLHTSKMSLSDDVDLDEFINQKDDLSGADIKAICSEAGLMALRERRMRVQMDDFRQARERVLKTKNESEPEGLYL